MGDFELVLPDSIAKEHNLADFVGKHISVKGGIAGDIFTVMEWG